MNKFTSQKIILKNEGSCIVREAEERDAEKLLSFLKQIMRDDSFFILTPDDINQQNLTVEKEKEWVKKHQNDGCIAIIAEINGNIAGLIHIANIPQKRLRHVGVLAISILESYRNIGLGSVLMKLALEWAKKNAMIEKVALAVFDTNIGAMKLYRKFGFIEEGRKVKEIKFSTDNYADSILMYKFVK